MSLNFTQIEIKTANFLNSWGDGVLVMVSGLVQTKEYSHQRKFIQMFFLAPQEKGYFVLNDYFHFVDEEQVQPAPVIAQDNFETNMASNSVVEPGIIYLCSFIISCNFLFNCSAIFLIFLFLFASHISYSLSMIYLNCCAMLFVCSELCYIF